MAEKIKSRNEKAPINIGAYYLRTWQCPTLTWRMPHYHRRYSISLLCSEWVQVVLLRYGYQANPVNKKALVNAKAFLQIIGGVDGTRTRDPRRDRPCQHDSTNQS